MKRILLKWQSLLLIYVIIVIFASLGKYFLPAASVDGVRYTKYNNYLIFKSSFNHLLQYKDLYKLHPKDHYDYFKYSPSFALFMFLFHPMPDLLGLIIWNLLNALVLFYGIRALPDIQDKRKNFILWFIVLEMITCIQNFQSNGIMAALIILTFIAFEKQQPAVAALFLVLSIYLKLFGVIALMLFILYPDKLKFLGFFLIWFILVGLLPLLVVSLNHLIFLYSSWINLLHQDQIVSYGQSIMGVLYTWFNLTLPEYSVLFAGLIFLIFPLFKRINYQHYGFRLSFLSSILIWVVIFNHKAESSTYIIAMSGAAIWYFSQEKDLFNSVLLFFALLFTSVSVTDIFPKVLRDKIILPYMIKALPCILIWFKTSYDLNVKKIDFFKKMARIQFPT
jgi:hypothetical protein